MQKQEVTEGCPVTFKCKLSKPGQKVTWCKNGKALSVKDYKIASKDIEYTLKIARAKLDDAAEYSILINDEKSLAPLTVKGIKFSFYIIIWDVSQLGPAPNPDFTIHVQIGCN